MPPLVFGPLGPKTLRGQLMISITAQSNYTSICLLMVQTYLLSTNILIKVLESNVNNELSKVHSWLRANRLSLNIYPS